MTNILTRHGDDPNHGNSGPGGPLGSEIEVGLARHAADTRPEYSPSALVLDVQAALAAAGVTINPAPSQLHVASLAAADLLRALGVKPATVPIRGRWSYDPPETPAPSGRANQKEQ